MFLTGIDKSFLGYTKVSFCLILIQKNTIIKKILTNNYEFQHSTEFFPLLKKITNFKKPSFFYYDR